MKRKAALICVSDTSVWDYASLSVCLSAHFADTNTPAHKEDIK
jgi:hypothetical protein